MHNINSVVKVSEGGYKVTVGMIKRGDSIRYVRRELCGIDIDELHPTGIQSILRGQSLYTGKEIGEIIDELGVIEYISKGSKYGYGRYYLGYNSDILNGGSIGKIESVIINEGYDYYMMQLEVKEEGEGYRLEVEGYKCYKLSGEEVEEGNLSEKEVEGFIKSNIEEIVDDLKIDLEYINYVEGK